MRYHLSNPYSVYMWIQTLPCTNWVFPPGSLPLIVGLNIWVVGGKSRGGNTGWYPGFWCPLLEWWHEGSGRFGRETGTQFGRETGTHVSRTCKLYFKLYSIVLISHPKPWNILTKPEGFARRVLWALGGHIRHPGPLNPSFLSPFSEAREGSTALSSRWLNSLISKQ